jgi:hypothetical protein
MYTIAERGYTKNSEFENYEIDRFAVASNYYKFNDFINVKVFILDYAARIA